MKRWPLVASFILFILLCASLAYWGMQLFKPAPRPVAAPPQAARAEARPEAAAALFGGRAGSAPVASNYQLKGVVMSGSPKDSVAIVGADGKPAQAVRAGAELMPGVSVKEVHRDYVLLSENGAVKRVELPESAKNEGNIATVAPLRSQPAAPTPPNQAPRSQPAPAAVAPTPPAPTHSTPAPSPATANAPAAGIPAGTPLPMAPIPGMPTTNQPSPQPGPAAPANPIMGAPPASVVSPPAAAPAIPGQVQRTPQPQGDPRQAMPGAAH